MVSQKIKIRTWAVELQQLIELFEDAFKYIDKKFKTNKKSTSAVDC